MLYKINRKNNQIIVVNNFQGTSKGKLTFYKSSKKIFEADAFIGKNGTTTDKVEGDGKTPEGIYELGLFFGTHNEENIELNKNIKYTKIIPGLYWVDDIYSKYYNQIVDINKVKKDWRSAEHLIEYPKQYEYAIEIKTNRRNIPGKR